MSSVPQTSPLCWLEMFRFPSRAPKGAPARRALGCSVIAFLAIGGLSASPASAQESDSDVTIELVGQPVSYDADGKLNIRVRISNESAEAVGGFTLNVGRESRLTSRSDLQDSFVSTPGVALAAITRVIDGPVEPGQSRVVKLGDPVSELLAGEDPGIYPATINLLDSEDATPLDSLTTHLMYYPGGAATQLNFAGVAPLNDLPSRGPDGGFVTDEVDGQPTLEGALEDKGWLTQTVSELNRLAGRLRLGVAPTPRLVEEVADMSDGYRRGDEQVEEGSPEAQAATNLVDQLRQVMRSDGIQPVLVPYAYPDLPSLAASGVDGHMATQITLGETVLSDVLEVDVDRSWVFPPGGRTNADALELMQLTSNTGQKTFFSGSSLVEAPDPLLSGCPIEGLSATCPVTVSTQAGETVGYEADAALQAHLTAVVRDDDDRLNLQRFFAETAMIREEQPGRIDRVVHASLPTLWHPSGRVIRTLFRGLVRAPWINTVTPEEGLELDIDRVERRVAQDSPAVRHELDSFDYATIDEAESTIQSFNSVGPPASMYQRLLRNYLVAESRNWWADEALAARGLDYASASVEEARAELDKVSIEVSDRITLTSRAEDIPVRVLNDAGYPVRVRFQLTSPRLTFEDDQIQTFENGRTPLTIPVRADASGIFPVRMALVTPDGSETIAESEPTVRSTEFNNIALTITVGALFFLIAFYLLRWYRRRNAPAQEPA